MSMRSRRLGAAVGAVLLAATGLGVGISMTASASSHGSHKTTHKSTYRVAVLEPGTANDGSWGQAVDSGALAAGRATGAKVTLVDALETPAQYQQQGASFASHGYNLVIIANGSDPQTVVALAHQFPHTFFCETAATIKVRPKNVCTNNLTYYDGDFLAGALAAMVSRTKVLGEIGGYSFPQLNWEMNGFSLGARYVDPRIKIKSTYVNTWTDVNVTRNAANAQIASGADVIFSATDQATQGIYAAAQTKGHTYAISQYFDTHRQAPSVVLTSVLFNLQGSVGNLIRLGVAGKLRNVNYETTFNDGAGRLAPFYNLAPNPVTPAIQARLHKIEHLIATGKIVVPALPNANQGLHYNVSRFPKA
ncbi:MAG TPA: BMP family protein [Acidimicrobiales bacterium]|nr:BMP family protein [Acidimicrobiales bacterium]